MKTTPRTMNTMTVDTITTIMMITQQKVLNNDTMNVMNQGIVYQIHNLEHIQIAVNVIDAKMIAHHYDDSQEVDGSMKGSDNKAPKSIKVESHKDSDNREQIMEVSHMEAHLWKI